MSCWTCCLFINCIAGIRAPLVGWRMAIFAFLLPTPRCTATSHKQNHLLFLSKLPAIFQLPTITHTKTTSWLIQKRLIQSECSCRDVDGDKLQKKSPRSLTIGSKEVVNDNFASSNPSVTDFTHRLGKEISQEFQAVMLEGGKWMWLFGESLNLW